MAKTEGEKLPVGVGRVPKWWMELTPHYTLDLEEQEARQKAEEEMAVYFANMNAASDAGMLDSDGKPLPGWEKWNSSGSGGSGGWGGSGGRNFSAGGSSQFDPKWFGIDESHPDYQAYLTGAKLPPGYEEMMAKYRSSGDSSIYNNLQQTNYGQYGRQAEKPQHQPSWVKMKLRSTKQGSAIRKGQYDDSPNRAVQRRIQETETKEAAEAIAAPPLDNGGETKAPEEGVPKPQPTLTMVTEQHVPKESEAPAPKSQYKKFNFNDYYYNAAPAPAPEQAPPEQQKTLPTQNKKYNSNGKFYDAASSNPVPESAPLQEEGSYDEEYEVEEYTEEYTEEEEYEEEDVYEEENAEPELTDLQAILAAKQAELARLQAQM